MSTDNQRGFPSKAPIAPGDRMDDGTIFAGISPDTGKPMYTTPADAPLTLSFNAARQFTSELEDSGHGDWRIPTKRELITLWQNRDKGALKGTFNLTREGAAGWYWSSTEVNDYIDTWVQRFSDGNLDGDAEHYDCSLRCVR